MSLKTQPFESWIDFQTLLNQEISPVLKSWLVDKDSLTDHLKAHFPGSFHVDVLHHQWGYATDSERDYLAITSAEETLIREVHLKCNDIPLVFARSVIPKNSLEGDNQTLLTLGKDALGALLFADQSTQRLRLECRQLMLGHPLFKKACPADQKAPFLWGRRSLFYYRQQPLLVAEYFLPTFIAAISESPVLEAE